MKHLLKISDFSFQEILDLLILADRLAKQKKEGSLPQFSGKTFALLFEKPSLRTRAAFESGANDLGIMPTTFGRSEVFFASDGEERESTSDIMKNLEGFADILLARVFSHKTLTDMAEVSQIPLINGLCDEHHPTQALCDALTIFRHFGSFQGVKVAYIGDGNNVAKSLMEISLLLGMEFIAATPKGYEIPNAPQNTQTHDSKEAVKNADVVYTDTWISMGDETEREEREKIFAPYQVNATLMKQAKKEAIFLHCLPAHRGQEVSAEVIDGEQSQVFPQAHARRDIARALLFQGLSS